MRRALPRASVERSIRLTIDRAPDLECRREASPFGGNALSDSYVDDHHIEVLRLAEEPFQDRAAEEAAVPGPVALAHDDHLDPVLPREGQDGTDDVLAP